MTCRAIANTGPLVAFLDRAERHHRWVSRTVQELEAPLLVCEPVLAEAMFQDRPMSLADACVVRMAELHERHAVLTLDSDFTIYRKRDGGQLALITPDAG